MGRSYTLRSKRRLIILVRQLRSCLLHCKIDQAQTDVQSVFRKARSGNLGAQPHFLPMILFLEILLQFSYLNCHLEFDTQIINEVTCTVILIHQSIEKHELLDDFQTLLLFLQLGQY